jgi:hypothetical protein
MPNWVFNHLSIEGDAEQIEKVKNQLNRPITKHYKDKDEEKATLYSNPIFSFWNIIAPPDDKLDEYFETSGYVNGKKTGESPFNWYNFNNREWGTKWDVAVADGAKYSDTALQEESDTSLNYRFDTAWGAPLDAIAKLSEQYPELQITLDFEEEQGWGGEYLFTGGAHSVIREWDIPESHADYVAIDREDSCTCRNEEDSEYWFDDCPNKPKTIELFASRDVVVVKE